MYTIPPTAAMKTTAAAMAMPAIAPADRESLLLEGVCAGEGSVKDALAFPGETVTPPPTPVDTLDANVAELRVAAVAVGVVFEDDI